MHCISNGMRSLLQSVTHQPPPPHLLPFRLQTQSFLSSKAPLRPLFFPAKNNSKRLCSPKLSLIPSRSCTAAAAAAGGPTQSLSGEIHVILGPMFAGKTTALIDRVQLESNRGRRVAMIKSNKDTRYGLDSIISHDGFRMSCWPLSELSLFKAKIGENEYDELDVIGIDEAQFFGDLYDFCRNAADHDGKTVIVAGLDGDYLRRSFGSILDLIPIADSVIKLAARCELCGQRAFFTLRKTGETKTELIGGADVYMPVCRQHYVNGQIVFEATRIVLEAQKISV